VWVKAEWERAERLERQESVATDKRWSWSACCAISVAMAVDYGGSSAVAESEEV
jgi:hypothetical protein